MTDHTPNLTDHHVLHHARTHLRDHLPLQADGYVCTTDDLLQVLLGVAVNRATIEALCADLVGTPDPETLRRYLHAPLRVDDLPALEQQVHAALADAIPAHGWARARDVAIDFHDRPSYGTTPQADGRWVRGEAHDGPTRLYRVATASRMVHGIRSTLALHFVLPNDETVAVLDDLLGRLATLGVRGRRLFLDTGFAETAVLA
jgi:crotonobetainyl-CoA:carnitine CoA-transferase CaiB-like acyl-CoA transferase